MSNQSQNNPNQSRTNPNQFSNNPTQPRQSRKSNRNPNRTPEPVDWDRVMRNLSPFILALVLYVMNAGVGPGFEKYYLEGLNRWINQLVSIVTGFFPVSIGEMAVYANVGLLVLIALILLFRLFKGGFFKTLLQVAQYFAVLYILFMLLWGFNYSRSSIAERMDFEVAQYDTQALYQLALDLTDEANLLRTEQLEDEAGVMRFNGDYKSVIARASEGYEAVESQYPFLGGFYGKAKAIKASELLSYTGITGIYIPFTAEANINICVPDLLLPATTLHEMAHQRGVAPEDEANFVAYITAYSHPDADFRYSGTVLALIHTVSALENEDAELTAKVMERYSEGLRRDLVANNAFWKTYEGEINRVASDVNDAYLKVNKQEDGVKSYGMMVDLLLSYRASKD